MSAPVSVRRTFSRGNVLYSGYLFKETRTFFGRRIERKLRFFILPRVRTTDVAVKLRLAYYTQPGDAVENGCFFITPKSYIEDMPDSESFATGPASPAAAAAASNTIATPDDDDGVADTAGNTTMAFGFRLYPTLESPPIPLWASSWEERELWKTAMTEGISLLAQKERVLRRDMRRRRHDVKLDGKRNDDDGFLGRDRSSSSSSRGNSSRRATRKSRSTTEDESVAHGSSGGIRGLMKFGKEILGYDQSIYARGSDDNSRDTMDEDRTAGTPGRRLSLIRQRSFSHGDAPSAAAGAHSKSSGGGIQNAADNGVTEIDGPRSPAGRNKSSDRRPNDGRKGNSRRRRSNPAVEAGRSMGEATISSMGGDPYSIASQQRQELRRRRKRSSRRLNMDASNDNGASTNTRESTDSTRRKRSSSEVDGYRNGKRRSHAAPAINTTSSRAEQDDDDEQPQSVSALAAEFKASILTRFSTESRGSSVGFNLNDPADRVCVAYLRTLQPVATEHQNISNILHPLLERLVLRLRNKSRETGILMTPTATSSSSSRPKVTTISAKEARLLHEFEQAYYSSTMMIRSHRQNVMLSLRPKLSRFLMHLEREIAIADGRGRASPMNASSSSSFSSSLSASADFASRNDPSGLRDAAASPTAAAKIGPDTSEASNAVVSLLDSRALNILRSGGCPAGVLHVEVLRGSKLYNTQRLVRQDPYVKLRVAGMRKPVQTQHDRSGGTEPEWTAESHGNMFALPIQGSQDVGRYPERLYVEVWNDNTLADSLIGQADIDVMPFVRNAGRAAAHWLPITGADGRGDHGRVLMRLRFENLAANRILTSDGMTQQIGSLHIGLPQAKLNLLILPRSTKAGGGPAAIEADRTSSSKNGSSSLTPSLGGSSASSSSSSSSSPSISAPKPHVNNNNNKSWGGPMASLNTSTEPTYAIRVSVEDYELLTEPISVRDMEADGTLSFASWALNRDGRQRIELPLAITNPFAKIEFVVFSVMPDTREERVLGSAETSLLHLVEQQTTASMEHEKLEELRWKRIDSSVLSHVAGGAGEADPDSVETSKRTPMLRQESVETSKYTAFQKSFQRQLANARGRGQEGLRTASALLRGPTVAKTNLMGDDGSAHGDDSGGGSGSDNASRYSGRPVMLPPCVLKLKSSGRKEDKEVGVLQLQLHYEESPGAVFIPRKVKLEDHDFSFRRFEKNVSRSIRMVRTIRSLFALGSSIMKWEEPLITGALLCLFIWTCLFAFERQIASLPIGLVIILLRQHKHRKSGRFRHDFVLRGLTSEISAAIGASARAESVPTRSGDPNAASSSTLGAGMPTELRVAVIAAKNLPCPVEGNFSYSMPSRSASVTGPLRSTVLPESTKTTSGQSEAIKPSAFAEVYFVAMTRKSARRREARRVRRRIRKQRAAEAASRSGQHSRGESYSTEGLRSPASSLGEGGYITSRSPRPATSLRESAELSFGGFLSPDDALELGRRIESTKAPRKVKLIESSSLVGRTNTEYETNAPHWGINQKSLGASRLHIPGERTVVERWHDHATAFKAILPQTSGRDLFGVGIGSRRTRKEFSERHPIAVAEAMKAVDASTEAGSFEWDKETGSIHDFEIAGNNGNDIVRGTRLSTFSGESVVVIRVYHEGKLSASSGGISLEDRNDCQCLGQAIIPLSDLVGSDRGVQGGDQPVFEKWIDLHGMSQNPASRARHATSSASATYVPFSNSSGPQSGGRNGNAVQCDEGACQVLVRLQLALPLPTWHTRRMLQQRIAERRAFKDRRRALCVERRQRRQTMVEQSRRSLSPRMAAVHGSSADHPRDSFGAALGSDAPHPQPLTPQRDLAQDSSPRVHKGNIDGEPQQKGVATPVRSSRGGFEPVEPRMMDSDPVSDPATASSSRATGSAASRATPKGKLVGRGGAYSLGTGYYGRFLKIRSSTKYVQNGLDNIARTFERVKNLLNWAHPSKTHAVLVVMLALSFLFLIVPTRYVILVTGIYLFTEKFRRQGTIVARSWHFINTIPSDEQLDGLFEDERSRFQERLQRGIDLKKAKRRLSKTGSQSLDLVSKPSAELDLKGAKVDLHANWEGYMQTYGRSRIGKTIKKRNTRYFALQSHGVLQWWLRRELAEAGQKPRGELFLSPADARSAAGDRGASMVLPIDRNNQWELELRGFRDRALSVRLVIVLIARSSNDREGWLHAIQQVIEQMEIQSELKTVEAMQEQADKEAERQMQKRLERQRGRRLKNSSKMRVRKKTPQNGGVDQERKPR